MLFRFVTVTRNGAEEPGFVTDLSDDWLVATVVTNQNEVVNVPIGEILSVGEIASPLWTGDSVTIVPLPEETDEEIVLLANTTGNVSGVAYSIAERRWAAYGVTASRHTEYLISSAAALMHIIKGDKEHERQTRTPRRIFLSSGASQFYKEGIRLCACGRPVRPGSQRRGGQRRWPPVLERRRQRQW